MTDAKRKDQSPKEVPNLGQEDAEQEKVSDDKLDHLHREKTGGQPSDKNHSGGSRNSASAKR